MTLQGKSLLAGKTGAPGGATFRAVNPATGELLAPDFHEASLTEVDATLHAAAAAFQVYRAQPPATRAQLLEAIATAIEALGEALIQRAQAETGLPVARLIVGSNRNDILTRFLNANDMSMVPVEPSLSPSMDIQVSSNFERLLFELLDRDPARTAATMTGFRETGRMAVAEPVWHRARALFHGFRLDDPGTEAEIRRLHQACDYLADPHSAIGIAAARAQPPAYAIPTIAMATAHPAKFPDAMERATGTRPALPPRMADLFEREERFVVLPNDIAAVQANVRALIGRNGG